jgi:8-oxo-dGTP pyrophosphatase MutT (NUDIX family)
LLFSSLEILFGRIESESDFPLWTPELLRDRRRPVRPLTPETATPASVLIALLGSDSAEQGPSVILTKRTQDLSTHAGQVSFPGGRAESTDATAEQTAIREASEEIGLDPAAVRVWGRLPDYLTATGFRIAPVIARVDAQAAAFERDQREVEEIFHVPLSFLMNPAFACGAQPHGRAHSLLCNALSGGGPDLPRPDSGVFYLGSDRIHAAKSLSPIVGSLESASGAGRSRLDFPP